MNTKPIAAMIGLFLLLFMSSCKFVLDESEYVGSYPGILDTETFTYTSCSGTLIISGAGDKMVNLELVSDSNATIYMTGLHIHRGYFLNTSELQINGDDVSVYISRPGNNLYLYYYGTFSSSQFTFEGQRQ